MEEDETYDEDLEMDQKQDLVEDEEEDEAFARGYDDEEEIEECAECGLALRKKVVAKIIEGEEYKFCSEECAKDFEESLAKTEE